MASSRSNDTATTNLGNELWIAELDTGIVSLFKDIYAYLTKFGLKMDDLYAKMASIPDFSALTKSIKDLERKLADLEKKVNLNRDEYDENKLLVVEREERIREELTN